MNTKFTFAFTFFVMLNIFNVLSQNNLKTKVALIEIDTKSIMQSAGANTTASSVTALTRLELGKLNIYSLIDPYDLEYIAKRDNLKYDNCFSTFCIDEIAKKLECEKVFTGSISMVADRIVVIFKVYDTKTKAYDKEIVKEFLNLPLSIPTMIRITLNEMYAIPNNTEEVNTLTKSFIFDEQRNNPYTNRLRADGPRMGLTFFTGNTATILAAPKKEGGFAAMPLMFQFGYQFEKQYLNQGNFQALFEVVPMLTGLDQGLFIPSITILNGMRNNQNGWEFAFGPSLSITKSANGFYDNQNNWHLAKDTSSMSSMPFIENRMDSRGNFSFHPSFVFALGKTFKSGKLNIPVNAYFVPSSNGYRFGISFGFNSRARYESSTNNN
jgi:hypothetical protein